MSIGRHGLGRTALDHAVEVDSEELILALLNRGADMEREDTAGTKPLDRSVQTFKVKGAWQTWRERTQQAPSRKTGQPTHLGLRGADMEREDLAGTKPLDRSDNNI